MAGVFEDFGGDVAERAGVGGGLLVGVVEAFCAVEGCSRVCHVDQGRGRCTRGRGGRCRGSGGSRRHRGRSI